MTSSFAKHGNKDHTLQENDILRSWSSMLGTLRECNACLRWLCCHALPPCSPAREALAGTARHKAAAAAQSAAPPVDRLLRLLLDTAVLEHQVASFRHVGRVACLLEGTMSTEVHHPHGHAG